MNHSTYTINKGKNHFSFLNRNPYEEKDSYPTSHERRGEILLSSSRLQ